MKQKPKQSEYNQTINLTSHLILTQPKAVMALLANYDVLFKEKPSRSELINEVVELLSESRQFSSDLGELLALHIQENGKAMMELEGRNLNDHDEDEFWGGLIKGAVSLVGGLFKKKRSGNSDGGAAARAASNAQAAAAKHDMSMQMARMREEQRRREAEERRRREEAEERRREEEARRRQEEQIKAENSRKNMLMVGGGMVMLLVVGFIATKSSNKPTYYAQPQMQPQMASRNTMH